MLLTELRHYISTHRRVTLVDLINRFEIQPEAMRAMLAHWIRKGKVRHHVGSGACTTGCSKCSPESLEFYEWMGKP